MGKRSASNLAYVRMTVTIPAELRADLDTWAPEANWSAWAADCFRARVIEIQTRRQPKKGANMKRVIERLRAAAANETAADYEDGKAAGRAWAEARATPGALRRLAAFVQSDEP